MATKRTTTPKTKANGTTAGAATVPAPVAAARPPSSDAIATRAYELWRASGCAHGQDQAHWFQAERELRTRASR
jgi:hypothetical protein